MDCIDALKVERDENDQRKAPTVSERVALAEAIALVLGDRKGSNQHTAKGGEIFPDAQGRNKDIAAAKAGLGSGKTMEAAQKVPGRNHAGATPYPIRTSDNTAGVDSILHSDSLLVNPDSVSKVTDPDAG